MSANIHLFPVPGSVMAPMGTCSPYAGGDLSGMLNAGSGSRLYGGAELVSKVVMSTVCPGTVSGGGLPRRLCNTTNLHTVRMPKTLLMSVKEYCRFKIRIHINHGNYPCRKHHSPHLSFVLDLFGNVFSSNCNKSHPAETQQCCRHCYTQQDTLACSGPQLMGERNIKITCCPAVRVQ